MSARDLQLLLKARKVACVAWLLLLRCLRGSCTATGSLPASFTACGSPLVLSVLRDLPGRSVFFCLETIIDQTLALIGIRARKQRVSIQFDRPSTSTSVEGDPGQIEQVLVNLMVNALEAMPDGGKLSLGLTCNAGHIELRVEDTGPEIRPAQFSLLFELFVSSKKRATGWGSLSFAALLKATVAPLKRTILRADGFVLPCTFPWPGIFKLSWRIRDPKIVPGAIDLPFDGCLI